MCTVVHNFCKKKKFPTPIVSGGDIFRFSKAGAELLTSRLGSVEWVEARPRRRHACNGFSITFEALDGAAN